MASDEPSITADQESDSDAEDYKLDNEEEGDTIEIGKNIKPNNLSFQSFKQSKSLDVTLFNLKTLFLLFKTDVTSAYSNLNNIKSSHFLNKPSGISIKYK